MILISDMSDVAISTKREVEYLLSMNASLQLLTDNKSLFDVISKGSRTSEKRTRLDIFVSREHFTIG